MINEKFEIEIRRRKITVEIEGMTQLEVHSLAQAVSDKMAEIERESESPDTSKLALLTAMAFGAEFWKLKQQQENLRLAEDRKLEELSSELQRALDSSR